jgi:hypothetical protein
MAWDDGRTDGWGAGRDLPEALLAAGGVGGADTALMRRGVGGGWLFPTRTTACWMGCACAVRVLVPGGRLRPPVVCLLTRILLLVTSVALRGRACPASCLRKRLGGWPFGPRGRRRRRGGYQTIFFARVSDVPLARLLDGLILWPRQVADRLK